MTTLPTSSTPLPRGALALLARIDEYHVEHVLIGGLAAAVHGCPRHDDTVVLVPARFGRNLERLARALRALRAAPRHPHGPTTMTGGLNASGLGRLGHRDLRTDLGALELDFEPPATAGHLDLFASARRFALTPSLPVEVAAPADLLRIAEMRRTPADEATIGDLRALLQSAAVLSRAGSVALLEGPSAATETAPSTADEQPAAISSQ